MLLAMGAFFGVVGPLVLNPQNIAWLGGGFDPTQHYLGWAFFSQSPWSFPLGLNPAFGMDISSSIVYSDSIPLLAFIFKPFALFLPNPFQYFGLWLLLCFILQGYFAWRLVALLQLSPLASLAATLLFIFSPPLFWRIGLHAALVGHWLILAALYLNFRPRQNYRTLFWAGLICASALVHFYLLTMVMGLWFASLLDTARSSRDNWAHDSASKPGYRFGREVLMIGILTALVMWQAGYFAVSRSATATLSYGVSRMNLLAPFDARKWSFILPSLPDAQGSLSELDMSARAYENFSYWGAGILCLFLCVIFLWVLHTRKMRPAYQTQSIADFSGFDHEDRLDLSWRCHGYLYALLIIFTLFAFSNQMAIGKWSFEFALPDLIYQLASMYRASSRFFWPAFYTFIFLGIASLGRQLGSKAVSVCLVIFACIQIGDTSSGWREIRKMTMRPVQMDLASELRDPFWGVAGKRYQHIVRIPVDPLWVKVLPAHWSTWAAYAAKYGLQTNSTYLARQSEEKLSQSNQSLQQMLAAGQWNDQTLYILGDQEVKTVLDHLDPQRDLLATVNGYHVLAPGWMQCTTCPPVLNMLQITAQMVQTQMGSPVAFDVLGNGKYFLQKGQWAYPEEWGIWAVGRRAELTLPLPKASKMSKAPTELVITLRALVNPEQKTQEIRVGMNGQAPTSFSLNKDDQNTITLVLSPKVIDDGYVQLAIDLPTARRPKDIGMGDDERLLAIGLKSATFR